MKITEHCKDLPSYTLLGLRMLVSANACHLTYPGLKGRLAT